MGGRRGSLVATAVCGGVVFACLAGSLYIQSVTAVRDRIGPTAGGVQPLAVSAVEIRSTRVPLNFATRGFLQGFEEVTVHAEVDGQIIAKHVNEGQTVRKGRKLFDLDTTFRQLTVTQLTAASQVAREQQHQAKAGLDVARAQVAEAEAAQQNAINEFERIEKLRKKDSAMPVEVDRITTHKRRCDARMRIANAALVGAISKRDGADAALAMADAQLEEAKARLERCVVVSPIDGVVSMVALEAGEYVRPSQPVCEVIRLDKFKLIVELSGAEAVLVKLGATARIVPDARPDDAFEGTVVRVGPRANPMSKRFPVELHVANRENRLLAGMFCRCILPAGQRDDVLIVPREAVFERYGAEYCYVAETLRDAGSDRTGPLSARLMRIETRDLPGRSGEVQVVEGLEPGLQVLTTAVEQLRDGRSIRLETPEGLAVGSKPNQTDATP